MFRRFLLAVALSIVGLTASAQDPKTYYNISDDGYAVVPIPFGFPYFGRLFTHSIFFDNGLVSFYDPQTEAMRLGGQQFNAQPLSNNIGSNFHYSIMPMWTDLVNNSGSYYTQTDSQTYLRYNWENISQWGHPNRLNSFDLEIRPTGFIGINYTKINIGGYPITAGIVGNAQLGEWNQQYYKPPADIATISSIQNWSLPYTQGTDCSNPLSNQFCPGYQQALLIQQCSANQLHSTSCPGYQQAFFTQQCSINSLYNVNCPGYAVAYLNYQCSLNSLYSTTCPGYEQAFFSQQCSLNPLYNQSCPGYADAFYVQQCNASPLYDSGCTGYAVAFFDQQCSLNGLYDRLCPNYAKAFADKNILNQPVIVSAPLIVSETVALVSDPVVNNVITTTATSASPAQAALATVPLTPAPAPVVATAAVAEKKETKTESGSNSSTTSSSSTSDKKEEPRTPRQQLAERRLAAARANAVEQGKNLANEMSNATSMEQQVAVQNVVLQAMGFNAGFAAYGKTFIPDGVGYKPFTIYNNQTNIDNARMMKGLSGASDRMHNQMIDSQYNRSMQ